MKKIFVFIALIYMGFAANAFEVNRGLLKLYEQIYEVGACFTGKTASLSIYNSPMLYQSDVNTFQKVNPAFKLTFPVSNAKGFAVTAAAFDPVSGENMVQISRYITNPSYKMTKDDKRLSPFGEPYAIIGWVKMKDIQSSDNKSDCDY